MITLGSRVFGSKHCISNMGLHGNVTKIITLLLSTLASESTCFGVVIHCTGRVWRCSVWTYPHPNLTTASRGGGGGMLTMAVVVVVAAAAVVAMVLF